MVIPYGTDYTCPHGLPPGECTDAACWDAEGSVSTDDGTTAFSRTLYRRSELAKLPKIEPLIDGVMSLRASVVFFGPTNIGKSVVALSWACCVATGTPWLGRPVRRLTTLYVIGEGASGYDDRVTAWETAWQHPVDDDSLIFSVKPASLLNPITWGEIAAEASALGVRFIVLDTFSSLAPDADETKDAAPFTRRMSDLAAHVNGTVLAVHHPGWGDPTRVRGGSQLEANVDEVLMLEGTATDPDITLSRKKVKDGEAGSKLALQRRPVPIGADESGTRYSVTVQTGGERADRAQPVALWLREWWGSHRDEWVSPSTLFEAGIRSKSAFNRDRWALIESGLVEQGEVRGYTKYRLTREPS